MDNIVLIKQIIQKIPNYYIKMVYKILITNNVKVCL